MQYFVDSKKQNIELSRNDIMSPFAKVTIKFKDLEKQISQLIEIDAYLTKEEGETIYPAWLEKTTEEERRRERRYEVDTYLRDFWRDKSTANISNIPKRAQYLFEYCGEGLMENNIIKENNVEFLIGGTALDFAEAMKSVETRINLADCCYQLARSTGDVTIRNTGYMLSDELRNLQTITLHRVGDFYEMFGDEAKLAAKVLELQLTYREINGERTDMVGVPYHVIEKYVGQLEDNNILPIFASVDISERMKVQEQAGPEAEETTEVVTPLWDEETAMKVAEEEWNKAHQPPKKHPTLPQSNYNAIYKIAPEVLDGTATYIKFSAGESFMPLVIEKVSDDRIAIYHHYELNGDLVADPDMTFKVDTEDKAL